MSQMTQHFGRSAPEGSVTTNESGRGMHASTAETPEKGSEVNKNIVPPTPGTAVLIDRGEAFAPPFDASDFAVVFRYSETPAQVEHTPDGAAFVMARRLIVNPRRQQIVVELRAGATVTDLLAADHDIRSLRSGNFNAYPWREWPSENHPGTTYYSTMMGTPLTAASDRIAPCTTAGCDESGRHHTEDHGEAPMHRHVIATGDGYHVHLWLDPHAGLTPRWETYVDADELTPDKAAALAADLQRAALEAEKLNADLEPRALAETVPA